MKSNLPDPAETRLFNNKPFLILVLVLMVPLIMAPTGRKGFDNPCDPGETNCAVLTTINFTPQDGNYNIGTRPNGKLSYSDLEHYSVVLQLDRPAPTAFSREFLIREDKFWGDATLGKFTASFAAGSTTPTISYVRQCCGATTFPTGTPANLTTGTFWMGCTKKGAVKANGPKGDNGHAKTYLEKVNKSDSIGIKGKFSPKYNINCP